MSGQKELLKQKSLASEGKSLHPMPTTSIHLFKPMPIGKSVNTIIKTQLAACR